MGKIRQKDQHGKICRICGWPAMGFDADMWREHKRGKRHQAAMKSAAKKERTK